MYLILIVDKMIDFIFVFIMVQFYHLMENKALSSLLCIRESVNDVEPMNFLTVMSMPEDSSFFSSDEFRFVISDSFSY